MKFIKDMTVIEWMIIVAIIGIILAILIGEPVRFIDNHNYIEASKDFRCEGNKRMATVWLNDGWSYDVVFLNGSEPIYCEG